MNGMAVFIQRKVLLILMAGLLLWSCEAEEQRQAPQTSAPAEQQVRYTLIYSAEANGSITGKALQRIPPGEDGSEVIAVADAGYHFETWSDGVTSVERTDRNVQADLEVTAGFSINQYTLDYHVQGNGSISGAAEQLVGHGKDGSPVTAVAAENHHFTGWSDGVNSAERIDREVAADLAVTARFALDQYTLNYAAGINGTISGPAEQQIGHGLNGSPVTAVPGDGYHFVSWSDGVTDATRTDRAISADLEVTASFAVNRYALNYAAGENGFLEGSLAQQVEHGGDGIEVVAVPDPGYHFVSWSDGVTSPRRTDQEIAKDLSVSAVFAVNTYRVSGSVTGLVEGTQVVLQLNGGDDLTVSADGNFEFSNQLLDGDDYAVTVLSQPTAPNQVCTETAAKGMIRGANVIDVAVNCELQTYPVGGTLSALPRGDKVVLQLNGDAELTLDADGPFAFPGSLEDGSSYAVAISTQPERPNWECQISNATGAVSGDVVNDVTVQCYLKAVLEAVPGIRSVELSWNSHDFEDATFNLCRVQAETAFEDFNMCLEIKKKGLETGIANPHHSKGLKNDVPYWFQLEVKGPDDRRTYSNIVRAMAYGGLNDSGIDWCSSAIANLKTDGMRMDKIEGCNTVAESHPGQDAFHGRDARGLVRSLDKSGNGSAGFDFTRLCRNGRAAGKRNCPPNPSPGTGPGNWGCTRDNVTGLIWEVKTDAGLQGRNNTYSWYSSDETFNGGSPGLEKGGKCEAGDCDSRSYVQAVNELEVCGISDWRLPTRKELLSIVDNSIFKPAVDARFFPGTVSGYYWTATPYAEDAESAWQVYLLYGETSPGEKIGARHVRLVSGKTMTFGLKNP